MKLTYIFSRAGRTALAAALGLFIAGPSISDAAVVVLKEGGDIDYAALTQYSSAVPGGQFGPYSQFTGLGNVATNVHVDDSRVATVNHSPDANFGQEDPIPNSGGTARAGIYKWDLSSLPGFAGSTINGAVIRIYQIGGNGDPMMNTISHHDWDEATVTHGSPAGNPFGAGPGEWGPGSNDIYSNINDTANAFLTGGSAPAFPAGTNGFGRPSNDVVGAGYNTWDATSDVQAMANGAPNYGWGMGQVNNSFQSSESPVDGTRPALFIDYTPGGVPEPTSLALLSLGAVSLLVRRKR